MSSCVQVRYGRFWVRRPVATGWRRVFGKLQMEREREREREREIKEEIFKKRKKKDCTAAHIQNRGFEKIEN